MPAASYNFNIEKGTSFVISFQYLDSNSVPINITNWCARLSWQDDSGNIERFYTNNITEDYSFTLDPLLGKILFKIPAPKTAEITWNSASYDLELQEPNNLYSSSLVDNKKTFRILEGVISIISPNVPYTSFECNPVEPGSCRICD